MNYNNNSVIPAGTIMMWYGESATIPVGWALCDGNNGTPDLRGRVVVGVNTSDASFDSVGKTGGHKEMQSHTHDLYGDNNGDVAYTPFQYPLLAEANNVTSTYAVGTTGSGDSGNLQPYHCLHYIMKV